MTHPPPDDALGILGLDLGDCPFPRGSPERRAWVDRLRDDQTREIYTVGVSESAKTSGGGEQERS